MSAGSASIDGLTWDVCVAGISSGIGAFRGKRKAANSFGNGGLRPTRVMPGLVPGVHAGPRDSMPEISRCIAAWMAGTSPAMTALGPSKGGSRPTMSALGSKATFLIGLANVTCRLIVDLPDRRSSECRAATYGFEFDKAAKGRSRCYCAAMTDKTTAPMCSAEPKRKFGKPLKIAASTFGLGPPIGYLAYFIGGFCFSVLDTQNKHPDKAVIPVVLLGLTGFPVLFAYLYTIKMGAIAAVLAPLVDYISPVLIPRRMLGAALGCVCGWAYYRPVMASIPDYQFQERAIVAFAGGVAGLFVAWVCQRAGWTKSPRP